MDLSPYMTYVRPVPRDEDMDYVFSQFQKNKAFTFLPIVDADDRPAGIIREFDFKEYIYGMFGRELIRKESVERFSSDCMIVPDTIAIDELLRQSALTPDLEGIVVTSGGKYSGVVLNKSLFTLYEENRLEKERHLSQVQKMEAIGTLAGGIAHDFNNMLMPILGNCELLEKFIGPDNPLSHYVGEIERSASRARDLVKQILTFSRKNKQERFPLHLSTVLKEVIKLVRSSLPSTIDIQIAIECNNDLVLADPTEVHQIIMNICVNAGHAMKSKGGVLSIKLCDHRGPIRGWSETDELGTGPFLQLSIADTGHGIDPALFPRIFEPFFTTKSQAEGTGMGLAMVHGIVKRYGGSISVESQIGSGSTFYIYLPQLPEDKMPQVNELEKEQYPRGNNLRVLYVDDEEAIARLAEESLQFMGFKVVSKTSSTEALDLFESNANDFDAIVTDQTMPGLTGLELAKRALEIKPAIPIFLCSGYNETVTAQTAKDIGISEYLTKPVNFNSLASLICKACGNGNGFKIIAPFS
jgi:signal transduction histidine kinase/CheY-like chemotaxis protein